MAATKIFPITATEIKALTYIADPQKTENGKYIQTFMCSKNPLEASKDFESVRELGTGRNSILSQHIIQSFSPGEVTPEQAMQITAELCDEFLKGEFQYFIALHNDKDHLHCHVIFNNISMIDGRTFETHHDQGDKAHRKWVNLRNLSDELCRKHGISVIENPEMNTGKSHYEWDMNRQNLSWKAKLKYAIDDVVEQSDDFEDFLRRCKEHKVEVVYNPEHVIDLKFRLDGQQKFTRARTLGWYYETKQIKRRIDMCKGVMSYTPRTSIIRTDTERMLNSFGLRMWADLQNMQQASKMKNILDQYGIRDNEQLEDTLMSSYAQLGGLTRQLNTLQTQIEDLNLKIKIARKVRDLQPIFDQYQALSVRKKEKFEREHKADISANRKVVEQLKELFPDGRYPSPESLEKKRNALSAERSELMQEYKDMKNTVNELSYARQALDDYIRNERDTQEKKRRKDDLE